jgi:outer membrane protein assembly complex protein YaeT
MPVKSVIALLLIAMLAAGCREEGGIEVASLEFEGVEQVDEKALANALRTRAGSWIPFSRDYYFDRSAFEADLKRIAAFYRDRGFPDARVVGVDTRLNEKQTEIDITVSITEGEPIRVAAISLEGFDVLPERSLRRLRRQMPLAEGMPLDTQLASTARERALNELRDHGYPYAEVQLIRESAAPRQERVVLRGAPGTLARFGGVEINGQASVEDRVILRQLTFEPGDTFSRTAMRESQRKLYSMELFEFVNVEPVENGAAEQRPEVPVRVTVAEGKHRKVTFGVGYGSEEKARARVRWDHVNFFGGARHAGIEGRWSSLDRGVRAELREPYFFHPRLSLDFQGQAWQASEPVYSQSSLGGRAVVRDQLSEQQFWSVSLINEYQRSTIDSEALADFTVRDELIALGLDPETGETRGRVAAVAVDVGRNTANNVLDARRGYVLNAHLEQAGEWMWGTYRYTAATFDARHYQAVGRLFVLANRLAIGSIDPAGDDTTNVPFHKRFFLGGSTSVRGWGRFEIAPLSSQGFPIGGLTMLDGALEVRAPVWGNLGGVVFLDYGNVWPDAWQFDLGDLRYAVGPGLRYRTPVGPIRVDLGYQLNPVDTLLVNGEPQKRRWRVHFSIGQAF